MSLSQRSRATLKQPLFLALALSVFLVPAGLLIHSWSVAAQTESAHAAMLDGKLGDSMNDLKRAQRKLRRQLKDSSKNASSLVLVVQMQNAIQVGKVEVPALAAKQKEGAERKAFVLDYRLQMNDVLKKLIEIEEHLLKNENDKAKKIFDGLRALQKKGHDKFQA